MNAPLPPRTTQRVLVVDDEPEIGELVGAVAEGLGIGCVGLTSARELDAVMDADVSAVFIDLMMPGVDGIELVRQLATRACRAPVVLMSGHDKSVLRSAEAMARALGLRTAGPLHKPFRVADVETLLTGLAQTEIPRPAAARPSQLLSEDALREAIESDWVVVHYQPQIALATGRVAGVEALVRLRHPTAGLVYPDRFIAAAEELGLIDALTKHVLRHALREVASRSLLADTTLSINVSAHSLVDLSLPDWLTDTAERHGLAPTRLMIEITESGLIKEFAKALDILARLRLRGVGLSIDDFGTGYSSMAQLRRIPGTELKIDRMFVNEMLGDDSAMAVVEETIGLAHRLNLKVVAEGVETEAQAEALAAAGCDIGQGYLYSRPIGIDDLDHWLAARAAA